MPRYALLLAYDGSRFAGWWRQPGRRTVAGCLDQACARLGEPHAAVVGASRTDTGVHALGQVAHLDCRRPWPAATLQRQLERQLPADCSCLAVVPVATDWHAVHLAQGKTYAYALDLSRPRDPFRIAWSWRPPRALSLADLQKALAQLPGAWDGRAFARRDDHRDEHRIAIAASSLSTVAADLWCCRITADRFSKRLVRSLLGAACAVAGGACSRDDLDRALAGMVTAACRHQLPAQGLCLEQVHYEVDPFVTIRQRSWPPTP